MADDVTHAVKEMERRIKTLRNQARFESEDATALQDQVDAKRRTVENLSLLADQYQLIIAGLTS